MDKREQISKARELLKQKQEEMNDLQNKLALKLMEVEMIETWLEQQEGLNETQINSRCR